MSYILAAIMWLAPQLGHTKIAEYGKLIAFEARWYGIDPADVLTVITHESRWYRYKKSTTNDYGLMQVHVARRGSARFLGREKELYDPQTNIREGTRIMAMWKSYHARVCKSDDEHMYLAHMKWGKVVKNRERPTSMERLRAFLLQKFWLKPVVAFKD